MDPVSLNNTLNKVVIKVRSEIPERFCDVFDNDDVRYYIAYAQFICTYSFMTTGIIALNFVVIELVSRFASSLSQFF